MDIGTEKKIACLGWGSLVWNPGSLPVCGVWNEDGPILPIEFLRQSKDGRLTLVINIEHGTQVKTLWTLLMCSDIEEARKALGDREGSGSAAEALVVAEGLVSGEPISKAVFDWARSKGIDAVVWTTLPAKFQNQDRRVPSIEEAVSYLKGLEGELAHKAEEYVRKAPKQIDTKYRSFFESELGWYHE